MILCFYFYFSKIIPSFFTIKEGIFLPLRLSCKESSTFLTKPLFPQEREDVTALRCSEPLRYKVGGPSKVFAILCGMGPPELFLIAVSLYTGVARMRNIQDCDSSSYSTFIGLKYSTTQQEYKRVKKNS